jgi:prolyl-tRNA synthetase
MRVTELFGETLRKAPADARTKAQQLLLRGGYLRQVSNGSFALTTFGVRFLERIESYLQTLVSQVGGQKIMLPLVNTVDVVGTAASAEVLSLQHGQEVMGAIFPVPEVLLAALCRGEIRSYRQLPRLLYQFQSLPVVGASSGCGLIPTREKYALSIWGLARNEAEWRAQHDKLHFLLSSFFEFLDLPIAEVKAAAVKYEGKNALEWVFMHPNGLQKIVSCKQCNTRHAIDAVQFKKNVFADNEPLPLSKVHTPETATIADLSAFLNVDPRQTAKVVFYRGLFADGTTKLLMCMVRGDMEVSETAARILSGAKLLLPATPEEITNVGCVPGFASPINIRREQVIVVADELITLSPNLITGANTPDYHYLNSNYGRDYHADVVGDLAAMPPEAQCRLCGSALSVENGETVASIVDLADNYSALFNNQYLDENGTPQYLHMGRCEVNLSRLLVCCAEHFSDENGLTLPSELAPFDIVLLPLKGEVPTKVSTELYQTLLRSGYAVLLDDRNCSPGIKFNDADVRGIPLRITISERSLQAHSAEIKWRHASEKTLVPLSELLQFIDQHISKAVDFKRR